ncbi:putative bifunctional diguanylate cyclase/phosphodiesterase [Alteromonas lipolytica]|uniref:Diguanylate cyclase n=1 Tax=Alteromonas lipolytica TaxID=1856405 RepID=A0A1E8FGD6_9ALTE|nr:bifunctional diguanylate cyclase/phosphodiesterase [Alteromonas lipolytica]OFI34969.1 hypothetical protein BFC17_15515 [Alteromonas lipolytica]GGF55485.1 hypothetical protein GCM10011338_04700 [Alteromonas lipolytica]
MQQIAKVKQDRSIKARLIWACLGVSLLVSAIYVTVSYRLTADISVRSELKAMANSLNLINQEISHLISEQKLKDTIDLVIRAAEPTPGFILVTSADRRWLANAGLEEQTIDALTEHLAGLPDNAEPYAFAGNRYLWQRIHSGDYVILYVQKTTALDDILAFVGKRLLITSVIVFWIAVWLALTLAALIAKRAKEINETLAYIATHDSLTGLPNRLHLIELLENALTADPKTNAVSEGCLLVIDLDKFKEVNDSFGYSAGDILLKEIAERLARLINAPAELIRTGGDEFIIWAPSWNVDDAKALAVEIVSSCNSPIIINGLTVNSGASIGISHFPSQAENTAGLIVCADTAMHQAKTMRSGWQVYQDNKIADYKDILQLRAELTEALAEQQIILFYQPKVDLITGAITGVEALCRWQHPRLGLLGPGQFIDLIEHSGKVQEFGRYIISRAFEQAEKWHREGILVPIAINMSPYNLLDPGLVDFISDSLEAHDLPARFIEIELTENETCINIDYIQSALERIASLGVSLAIDDFGTGMSSLAYLSELRVNVLKIDRIFVHDMATNNGHRAIIAAAITLSQSFGCHMVAEGVETQEQVQMLVEMGCKAAQGFLFAKPMAASQLTPLLTQAIPLHSAAG